MEQNVRSETDFPCYSVNQTGEPTLDAFTWQPFKVSLISCQRAKSKVSQVIASQIYHAPLIMNTGSMPASIRVILIISVYYMRLSFKAKARKSLYEFE